MQKTENFSILFLPHFFLFDGSFVSFIICIERFYFFSDSERGLACPLMQKFKFIDPKMKKRCQFVFYFLFKVPYFINKNIWQDINSMQMKMYYSTAFIWISFPHEKLIISRTLFFPISLPPLNSIDEK